MKNEDTTEMLATSKDVTSNKEKTKSEIKGPKIKMLDPTIEALKSMQKAVRSELINCRPGDELETLIQTLQHTVPAQQVREDVLAAFQNYYPRMFEADQIRLFGSTVIGLAFKDSDLDFYIELPKCEQHRTNKARTKVLRNILEPTRKFARFESITRPRVPIIKCTHIGTLTNCDFNCSNPLGSLNSPIIAHLLHFDHRIRQLAIIIKYWMKIHDCAGADRISNYAVVWMLIFYLQTLPEPIVPPIDEFQRNVPPSMVSHYNFAFDYAKSNQTKNQSEWPELLLGFFEFYRDFDYDSQLICPLYGKTLTKTEVKEKKIVELQRYKQILLTDHSQKPMQLGRNSVCIQDPFEILRKVPGDISFKNFQKIVWKIGYAAEIIECELRKGDTKSLLLQIFDVDKFDQYVKPKEQQLDSERKLKVQQRIAEKKQRSAERKQAKLNAASSINERNDQITTNSNSTLSIPSIVAEHLQSASTTFQLKRTEFMLSAVREALLKNEDAISETHSVQQLWAQEAIQMIAEILTEIFRLELHNETSDKFEKVFDLTGARDVFVGRRRTKTVSAKTWAQEVLSSLKHFRNSKRVVPLKISAKVTADVVNFDYISVEFSDHIETRKNNFFRSFCSYFNGSIDYWLKIYFLHRTGMGKLQNGKPTTQSTAEQESMTALPILLIDFQNSQRLKTQLNPTKFALSVVRDMWLRSGSGNAESEEHVIRKLWAQEVIKMIADILSGIFRLEILNESSHPLRRTFDLVGLCDKSNRIFLQRKHESSVSANTWINELIHSSNRYISKALPCDVPLKLSVEIAADTVNFDWVTIEFSDRIKTRKQNFYKTFCNDFISRVDYFQKIYFVHRNEMSKSGNFNPNPAEIIPATVSTLTAFPNASSPKTINLKPTEPMLFIIRDMLSKSINDVDSAAVRQFWAETTIEFVIQMLRDIFRLGLFNITPDRFRKSFDVGGACNVFIGRKQQDPVDGNSLNLELQESVNRFVCTTKPLILSARITTDVNHFDSVSIELSDRIKTEKDNFYGEFCQQFQANIDYLLQVYFVHRHQMILNSNTLQCKFVRYEPVSESQ